MAAAYAYAVGDGAQPNELRTLHLIERFGVKAVLNRDYLGAREINRMLLAENIYSSYKGMSSSQNWSGWANENPDLFELIEKARKFAVEFGMVE